MKRALLVKGALTAVAFGSLTQAQQVHGLCADFLREQGHVNCMVLDNGLTRIHVFENSELNWNRLTIPSDQTLQFTFEQGGLTVVNRVLGNRPTQIRGSIDARGGNFVLLNPNSWLDVRETARIESESVVLSGLDAETAQFFSRDPSRVLRFTETPQSNPTTLIKGTIKSSGDVVLTGRSLTVAAEIEAEGSVVMVAGNEVDIPLAQLARIVAKGDQRNSLVTGVQTIRAGKNIAAASPQLMDLVGNWVAGPGFSRVYVSVNDGGRIEIGQPGLKVTGVPEFSQAPVNANPTIGPNEGDLPVLRTPAVNMRPTRGRRSTASQPTAAVRPKSGTVSARVKNTAFTRETSNRSSSQNVTISAKAMRGFYGLRMKVQKTRGQGR